MARVRRVEKPEFPLREEGDSREFSIERGLLQVQRDGWVHKKH